MIQRIQSLYLLLITVILGLMLYLDQPYFTATQKVELEGRTVEGIQDVGYRTEKFIIEGKVSEERMLTALVSLESIIALIALATIFLYRNRPLQLRLSTINLFLMIGLFVVMYMHSFGFKFADEPRHQELLYTALIPLALIILDYLAIRRINADEKLIRSLDRIR